MGPTWRRSALSRRYGAVEPGALRIFFDLETSGVGTPDDTRARVVSIAAAVETSPYARLAAASCRASVPRGCFSSLVNPFGPQSPYAVKVHGLTDEALAAERGFEEVWEAFCGWAHREQALVPGVHALVLVGHNSNSHDVPKLLSELRRAGREIFELLAPGSPAALSFEDTYPRRRLEQGSLRSALSSSTLRLSDVYASAIGTSGPTRPHDALWDAAALRDAWRASEAIRRHAWRRTADEALAHWLERG